MLQSGTVCFVASELGEADAKDQIGTHVRQLSTQLARGGWNVHLLLCDAVETEQHSREDSPLICEGATVHLLETLPAPPGAGVRHFGGDHRTVVQGEHVLEALEALHAEHRFDLIEFPDHSALGLRAIQSKVAGDALPDVPVAVKLHGPSRWQRERNLKPRSSPRDLKLEFCERYAFERADVQLSTSAEMLDYVEGVGWEVRPTAAVVCPSPDLAAVYGGFARRADQPPEARVSGLATVTIAVAHYNHDKFLPEALASLAAQTRPADEVIVVDDGSTSAAARRVFAEQEARYPEWSFIRQKNTGPGVARNRCLERASSAYFLPFDSDNVAAPELIERLLGAMEANPSRAATTCHNLGFVEDTDIEAGNFVFRYAPTGGPRLSACVENVYGDTCAMFRIDSLRSVGGFETQRWSPHEDWETFVTMTLAGLEVGVLPRPLFYYRVDAGGRLQELTADRDVIFRQRARLIDRFSAAELTARERCDLWECLQAFDHLATDGVDERLEEQRSWHESQMADLHAFRRTQLEEVRTQLAAEVEAQRIRAEAAEGELASLVGITPRRLARRALRAARSRVSRSSKSVS